MNLSPSFLRILAVVLFGAAIFLASGCAGFQQVVSGYETAAIKGIQAAEDNNIRIWSANACGTPFSAAIRNPQLIPALKALCLPAGSSGNPSALFEIQLPDKAQPIPYLQPAEQTPVVPK
ncbi:MAG: hypothetical protein K2Y28_08510 [Burkholderiaceae bacterium]|nr:hypothetical protein [Burkholderiaceae bacterium]